MVRRAPIRFVVAAAMLTAIGAPTRVCASEPLAVTAVRFWTLSDVTRIVVETTGEFEYHSDRVPNPDRVFFDLFRASMRLGKKPQHTIAVGDRLIKQIRVAETLPGVTRVVFDLESNVDVAASQLTNPSRLIVELRPAGTPESPISNRVPAAPTPELAALDRVTAAPTTIAAKPDLLAKPQIAKTLEVPQVTAPDLPRQTPKVETSTDPARGKDRATAIALAAPKPAKLGRGSQSMTRVLGLKLGRIVLDAGHGGHDTGTIGPKGLVEKELALDVAKRLGNLIETKLGAEVVYTRSDDTFVPLETRTQLANDQRADLFLSIHANSSRTTTTSGVETYYLNFTSSRDAQEVAARENASSQKTVYELKDLLQRIALQDKLDESREFADMVQKSLYTASVRANGRTRDRGVKKAPFVVLIGAEMPSVLVEIGFVSNPRDESLFRRRDFRQKIAEGLFRGLSEYAETLSQFQVASK